MGVPKFHLVGDPPLGPKRFCGMDSSKGAALHEPDFRRYMSAPPKNKLLCEKCIDKLRDQDRGRT